VKSPKGLFYLRRSELKFLVVTKSRQSLPPEAAVMMLEGMREWAKKYSANKKFEQIWSFSGLPGGGGIVNVSSIEELDAIMAEYPLAQFSETQIYPLVDIDRSIDNAVNAIRRMMPVKI
jgi:muconolactone delta-isomerase